MKKTNQYKVFSLLTGKGYSKRTKSFTGNSLQTTSNLTIKEVKKLKKCGGIKIMCNETHESVEILN